MTAPERILTVCRVCGVFVHNGDELMRERARQTGLIPQVSLVILSQDNLVILSHENPQQSVEGSSLSLALTNESIC